MQKWEYRFVLAAASGFEKKKEETFVALGVEGWELSTYWQGYFIFKRVLIPTYIGDVEDLLKRNKEDGRISEIESKRGTVGN